MSVLIKGMGMPTAGQELVFADGITGEIYARLYPSSDITDYETARWHEVVLVPGHGRLIDGDVAEVISFNPADAEGKDFVDGILYAADFIDKMPTIIPAEEAHNGE